MKVRFHFDPLLGKPHIYSHGVDEDEYEDRTQTVMGIPLELVPLVRELFAKYHSDNKVPV